MIWLINSLLIVIASITFSIDIQGNNDHFTYKTEEVNTILAPLNKLELLHNTYPEKPLQDLIKDQDLVDYSFIGSTNPQNEYMDQLPILPAFYYGCILSVIGIIVVYLVTQDEVQIKNAFLGCFVNLVFIGIILLIISGIFGMNFHLDLSNWTW